MAQAFREGRSACSAASAVRLMRLSDCSARHDLAISQSHKAANCEILQRTRKPGLSSTAFPAAREPAGTPSEGAARRNAVGGIRRVEAWSHANPFGRLREYFFDAVSGAPSGLEPSRYARPRAGRHFEPPSLWLLQRSLDRERVRAASNHLAGRPPKSHTSPSPCQTTAHYPTAQS